MYIELPSTVLHNYHWFLFNQDVSNNTTGKKKKEFYENTGGWKTIHSSNPQSYTAYIMIKSLIPFKSNTLDSNHNFLFFLSLNGHIG